MNWLRKIEARQTPPGAEMRILKRLPRITLIGTLLLLAMPALVRILPSDPAIDACRSDRQWQIA